MISPRPRRNGRLCSRLAPKWHAGRPSPTPTSGNDSGMSRALERRYPYRLRHYGPSHLAQGKTSVQGLLCLKTGRYTAETRAFIISGASLYNQRDQTLTGEVNVVRHAPGLPFIFASHDGGKVRLSGQVTEPIMTLTGHLVQDPQQTIAVVCRQYVRTSPMASGHAYRLGQVLKDRSRACPHHLFELFAHAGVCWIVIAIVHLLRVVHEVVQLPCP
jgi:hypothetical protein